MIPVCVFFGLAVAAFLSRLFVRSVGRFWRETLFFLGVPMALIGYARVSTRDQETHLQLDALGKAGVVDIRQEKGSSVGPRPELQKVLASLVAGDVLVVYKMDRVARSLKDLLSILDRIQASGAAIRSLTEPLDTSGPIGTFMVQVLGAVAQLERSIIRERALAGQVAAYNRGVRWGGRAPKLSPADQLELFRLRASGLTLAALALRFNVADSTISRYLTPPAPSSRRVKLPVLGPLVSPND